MKKNAFTLVELLATIVIVAAIALLISFSAQSILSSNTDKAYEIQIDNIKQGAKNWMSSNLFSMPKEGDSIKITLGQLKSEGFLADEIINPKNDEPFSDNLEIKITNQNGEYIIELIGI